MTKYTKPIAGTPVVDVWDTEGLEALSAAELLEIIARDRFTIARHVGGCADGNEVNGGCGEWRLFSGRGYLAEGGTELPAT